MFIIEEPLYYFEETPDKIELIKVIGLSARGVKFLEDRDYSIMGNRVYFPEHIVFKYDLFNEVTKLTEKLT